MYLRKYNEFEDPPGLWLDAMTKIFMVIPYHDPPIIRFLRSEWI